MNYIMSHIQIIENNHIPKDNKGNEFKCLEYTLDSETLIESFFNAMLKNSKFKGDLIINSTAALFNDSTGFKVAHLIKK